MNHKTRKKDLFYTIYTYSLITIILVVFFSLLTNFYYFRLLLKNTEEQYNSSLEQVSNNMNRALREIIDTATLISTYEELNEILFHPGQFSITDYGSFFDTQQILSRFKTAKDSYIYSAFIVISSENKVISNTGSSTIGEFSRITHISNQYNTLGWLFLDYTDSSFHLLPPGTVRNESMGTETAVLPLVIFQLDNRLFSNPLVIDIKQDSLTTLLDSGRQTPNSILYMKDGDGDILLKSSGSEIPLPEDSKQDSRIVKYRGLRYLTIVYMDPMAVTNEWSIHAVVPYSDLIRASLDKISIPLIILSVSLISSALLAYFLSGRIYNPIGSLISGFRSSRPDDPYPEERGELDYLKQEINRIIEDREKLTRDLSQAVPYVCERFFLSLLNGESLYSEEEIRGFLTNHGIFFERSSYSVVLTSVNFVSGFYNEFTREDHDRICSRILKAFRNYPLDDFEGYHFLMDADRICSIYNVQKEESLANIASHVKALHNQLDLNSQTMTLTSGAGRIYHELTDLKLSYREAIGTLGVGITTEGNISVFSGSDKGGKALYTIEDENILFNLLLQGELKPAELFINKLELKALNKMSGEEEQQNVYRQLYNTGKRVLSLRNMSDFDLMGEEYINIVGGKTNLSSHKLKEYVTLFLTKLMKISRNKSRLLNMENLKAYLNEHFQEDLYLDRIGEEFGISSKYASRLIKQELGMSFQKYISRLRIARAKELLSTTDQSIESIASEIGFNSRHPFIRMFKILEGVTPSDYRKGIAPHLKKDDSPS